MGQHAARPIGQHDTRDLRRHERSERRAFWWLMAVCAGVLAYVATHGAEIARMVVL
jgi:hypothetical protein